MNTYKALAQSLVDFLYPWLEASLFTASGELISVLNPFSILKEDQECELEILKKGGSSHEILTTGGQVKCLVHTIPSPDGGIEGFLRFRFDTHKLSSLKDQLESLLQTAFPKKEEGGWQSQVDKQIAQYLKEHQITIQAATPKQKRELISLLHQKRLFEFKEASAYIAAKMDISRATIYNYLKTISTLQQVQIHQVDAFTDKKFGGNPAGVVLDAEGLDEPVMRKITRELNLSETSFVLPSKKADFRLRYFTPTGHEVSFCGHSTVGALFVIAHEKRYQIDQPGTYRFRVETLSGILNMQATVDSHEKIKVAYEPPAAKMSESKLSREEIAKACGVASEILDESLPIRHDAVSKTLFIPVLSLDGLKQMHCDFKAMTSFSKENGLIVLCFLTKETIDPLNQIHMRCFAPVVGINEDPFTGSVLGGLAVYVHQAHLLPRHSSSFKVEQGHCIDRPGEVEVGFSCKESQYEVRVFAQAVHCFSTQINLT
jgi:PhzF family phenazine biosynthesis protein